MSRATSSRQFCSKVLLTACLASLSLSAQTTPSTAAPKAKTVRANGLIFPTLAWGSSDDSPVLLLHGFPEDAQTWSYIAEGLAAAGFYVVSFDQRGYAATTRPANPTAYNFDLFVRDALAIADAYRLRRFIRRRRCPLGSLSHASPSESRRTLRRANARSVQQCALQRSEPHSADCGI